MSRPPFLERRSPLGIPYALLILTLVFFLMPSAFRAARLSLGQKENDVKDWLPSDFAETAELEWFAKHFAGESFVLATWPGCTSGDQRLRLLEQKLRHECIGYDPLVDRPPTEARVYALAKAVGNELQLLRGADDYFNWGGLKEKWLCTPEGKWYYITPSGHLFRWDEAINGPAAALRMIQRATGHYELQGQFVTAFGDATNEFAANPFHNDTSLVCASLFHTVQTGDSLVDDLAAEGGPLWPVDLTEGDRREVVARRRAMARLTGTLFAPAVPDDFAWTGAAFRAAVTTGGGDQALPEDFDALVDEALGQIVKESFEDKLENLELASEDVRTDVWYTVFDAVEVEPPPRVTALLVTLTDLAKENLSYALGRGVLGQPRGRLLQLAFESGVTPAPPPAMAPPPFGRQASISENGMPPLRIGGPPVDNMAIDEEGTITLVRLVGYSILIGVVLSYVCFRSIRMTIMLFIVGGSAAMLSMAIVWWTSGQVDAILMSMPALVYVLGLSGAIHVINYYRDEERLHGQRGAAGRALRHALIPCTLASITTAIGLISLFTSNLTPISNFGLYSAIGVVATLGILFSYLPAALETFMPPAPSEDHSPAEDLAEIEEPEIPLAEWWAAVGRWITGHHGLVTATCLVVLAIGSIGLLNIKTSVQLLKLFDSDARIISDYRWVEENFGKLVPMELIVRVPPAMQHEFVDRQLASQNGGVADTADNGKALASVQSLELIERVEAVTRIRTVVERTLGQSGRKVVGHTTSADTFLPPLPAPDNGYNPIRSKYNKDLVAAGQKLRDNDYLRIEESGPYADSELWRISLRVAALSDVDYGYFITTLRESVEPVLRAYDTREALLASLMERGDGKWKGKQRVLMVGSDRPPPLRDANLLVGEDDSIDTRQTYLSTLGELLSGEPIEKSAEWREVSRARANEVTAKAGWQNYVKSFDAVVWLGSQGFDKDDFAAANRFVDAEAVFNKSVKPTLVGESIPSVEGGGPLQVVYTGVVPVVYKAQRTLLSSLANSIGLAFVLIAAVMVVLLNPGRFPLNWLKPQHARDGLMAGLIAMIPNVFPVLLVFGIMCHLGIAIDIGTMMTASVAMGVAVDDTIHFLSWYREFLDRGMNRVDAVIETYRRVGPAMTQTTIVGGLGLFVFALSTFTPTQRFGVLMLVMLTTALIGDLVLLPALLAGPAGRWFKPKSTDDRHPVNSGPPAKASGLVVGDVHVVPPEVRVVHPEAEPAAQIKLHLPGRRSDPSHRTQKH